MDDGRFDALARGLAGGSRRTLLRRLLGGAAAAGMAAGISPADRDGRADAAPIGCKAAGKHCKKAGQCCPGLVCAGERCVAPTLCHEPSVDSSYAPTCRAVTTTCTAAGNILGANCQDIFGEWRPTSINVDGCAAQNYVIVNCDGTLTCGGC